MQSTFPKHHQTVSLWRDERGVVFVMVLVIMVLLLGMGLTSLFSAYTNLLSSTNLKLSSEARNRAEAAVNEAIYRLSRQEGQPGSIVPDLSKPNWQVEIDFSNNDSDTSDGSISTLMPGGDWPDEIPSRPVIIRFRKPDPAGNPNRVLFYNRTLNPPFQEFNLPADLPIIPADARPMFQIVATGLDDRDAERQLIAEVTSTVAFAPPAPLSSGVNVDLGGASFIDGVNHHHMIDIRAGYGSTGGETTDSKASVKDSPDDNVMPPSQFFPITVQAYPAGGGGSSSGGSSSGGSSSGGSSSGGSSSGGVSNPCPSDSGVANPSLNKPLLLNPLDPQTPAYSSCARLFNMQISAIDETAAWEGLRWIKNPLLEGCVVQYGHSPLPHWHGTNTGYASAVALSSTPTVVKDKSPTSNVWKNGVFTWRASNIDGLNSPTFPADCTISDPLLETPPLVCRPTVLTHDPDRFENRTHFPHLQEFLNMDDVTFQNLLDKPDTTKKDLDAGKPPLGFTYIQGDLTFNSSTASPSSNDFGLLYVTGDFKMNGNQTFKGLIFVDGSLSVNGNPIVLGAIMVRGTVRASVGTGNMTLLYSRRAAELGIQSAHP